MISIHEILIAEKWQKNDVCMWLEISRIQASFLFVGTCSSVPIPSGFAWNASIPQSDTGKHGQHTASDTVTGSDSGIGCDQDRQNSMISGHETSISVDFLQKTLRKTVRFPTVSRLHIAGRNLAERKIEQ